ncbi:MAG: histidine ammonia-lyase [Methanobacteriota archaeon]|nr:MAG: histidine ammonia-lyase [Euryarchaeota archaeon]
MPRRSSMRSIDGRSLDLDDVVAVARQREPVRLAPAAAKRVDASRRALEKVVAKGSLAYGIKTGFGELANVAISDADVRALQLNLLRSHAIGLGPPLRQDEVRAALLLRANTLAMGYSGVRRILVTRLLDFLNLGVHPVIPSRGSLGASGDLAPLAHLGLVLVGEGEAEVEGQILPGPKALAKAKLAPLVLQSKEGLAIINGTSVMAAVGAIVVNDGLRLLKDAQVAASMSFEALRGSPKPFDDRLVGLKPQPGAREVAANLRRLLRGSEIIPSHKGPHKVQDPYTLRCIPQVLGAVRATLEDAAASLRIEMNAATDNPLIFPEGTSVSGGNFHAQALAMALDHVALGMAVLAGFSERRIARLVDTRLSELPPFLTEKSGLNSGMMIVQYVAAGYASDNKVLAHPASADSIPTSANQEDFVPMGMAAALKARQSLENAARVVALEVLAAAQGLEFLKPLRPGIGPRAAHAFVRSGVPPLVDDRSLAPDANRILEWMATGELLKAVEGAAGRLA